MNCCQNRLRTGWIVCELVAVESFYRTDAFLIRSTLYFYLPSLTQSSNVNVNIFILFFCRASCVPPLINEKKCSATYRPAQHPSTSITFGIASEIADAAFTRHVLESSVALKTTYNNMCFQYATYVERISTWKSTSGKSCSTI